MQTRFMQRVFSAMDDGEDELLAQITNDVSDAERTGIKDTLQMRYIRMPDLVIKAVDNRTGEETLIKRSGSCMILRPGDSSFNPDRNRILANADTAPLASLLPLFCCERAPHMLRDKVFACFSANYFGIGARESFNITPDQKRKLRELEDKKRAQVAKYDEQLRKLEDNPNNKVVTDYGISTDTGVQDKIAEIKAKRDLAQAGANGVRAVSEHDRNSMEKYAKDSWNANARLDVIESNKERAKNAEDKQKEARRDFQQGSGADRYKGYGGRGTKTTKSTIQPATHTYSSEEYSLWNDGMGYEFMQKMFGLGRRLWDVWKGGSRHYEKPSRYDQGKTPSSERPSANTPAAGNGNISDSLHDARNSQDNGGDTQKLQNGTQNGERPLNANDKPGGMERPSGDSGRPASNSGAPDYGRQIADLRNAMSDFTNRIEAKIDGMSNNADNKHEPKGGGQSDAQAQGGATNKEAPVDVSPHSGADGQTPPPYNPSQTPPPYNPAQAQSPENNSTQLQPPPYTPPAQMSDEEKERMTREQDFMSQLKQGLGADMQSKLEDIHSRVAGESDAGYWKMMKDEYGVKGPEQQRADNIRANIENVAKYRASQFEGDERDIQAFNQRMADVANAKRSDRKAMWNDPQAWTRSNQDYANSLGRNIGQNVQIEGEDGSNARFYYVDSNGDRQYLSGPGYMPMINRNSVATAISHNWKNKVDDAIGNTVEGAKNALYKSSVNAYRNAGGGFFNKLGAAMGAFGNTSLNPTGATQQSAPGSNAVAQTNNASIRSSNAQNARASVSQQGQAAPPNYTDTVLQRIQGGAGSDMADKAISDFNAAMQAKLNTVRAGMSQAYHQHNAGVMDNYDAVLDDVQKAAQAHGNTLNGTINQMRQVAQNNSDALQREANKKVVRSNVNQMLAGR